MDQSILIWGIVIILGFPGLALILIECKGFFERRGSLFAPVVSKLWRYVFPCVAILLVMKQLLKLTDTQLAVKFLETGFWIAAIFTLLSLLNAVLTTKEVKPGSFQIQIPNLFFQVSRVLVLLGISYYIIEAIWKVNLSNLATALGVGSLVIALALQDTLNSLVSGFLLVFDSPFKIGDWIKYEDIEGQVIDQNWKTVRVKTIFGDLIIIPNSTLGQAVIINPVNPYPWVWRELYVRFSYDDPPNKVKQVILELIRATEGVFADPDPKVTISSYEDFYIQYYVGYAISDSEYELCYDYDDTVMTKIYYAAKRHKLTMPIPTRIEYQKEGNFYQQDDNRQEIQKFLGSLAYFSALNPTILATLAEEVIVKHYGVDELIIKAGEPDEGLYILLEGRVKLLVKDIQGEENEVDILSQGDFFGEMALFSGELSPVSALALDDIQALAIDCHSVQNLLDSSLKFAREINYFIEERKRSLNLAQGIKNIAPEQKVIENGDLKLPHLLGQVISKNNKF